jgi:hypothetical protein
MVYTTIKYHIITNKITIKKIINKFGYTTSINHHNVTRIIFYKGLEEILYRPCNHNRLSFKLFCPHFFNLSILI